MVKYMTEVFVIYAGEYNYEGGLIGVASTFTKAIEKMIPTIKLYLGESERKISLQNVIDKLYCMSENYPMKIQLDRSRTELLERENQKKMYGNLNTCICTCQFKKLF